MSKSCKSCGQELPDVYPLDTCPGCRMKKQDYRYFKANNSTRGDIAAISLGHYMKHYAIWGSLQAAIMIVIGLIGCVGGAAIGNMAGGGTAMDIGFGHRRGHGERELPIYRRPGGLTAAVAPDRDPASAGPASDHRGK